MPFTTVYHRHVLHTEVINKNGKAVKTVLRKKYFFLKLLLMAAMLWVRHNI
jgi:hypothetical protein